MHFLHCQPIVYKFNFTKVLRFTFLISTFVTEKVTIMNIRLQQFLAAENISQAHFADTINVARAGVSHILAGRNKPSYDFLTSVMLHYPNLSLEWLMTGKGRMYKNALTEHQEANIQEQIHAEQPVAQPINTIEPERDEITEKTESVTLTEKVQLLGKQRNVSKIIVLFDDGSYQEL